MAGCRSVPYTADSEPGNADDGSKVSNKVATVGAKPPAPLLLTSIIVLRCNQRWRNDAAACNATPMTITSTAFPTEAPAAYVNVSASTGTCSDSGLSSSPLNITSSDDDDPFDCAMLHSEERRSPADARCSPGTAPRLRAPPPVTIDVYTTAADVRLTNGWATRVVWLVRAPDGAVGAGGVVVATWLVQGVT